MNFCFCFYLIRSKLYGWPNTYVFTKAMGEMIIGDLKDEIPLIVIRPTIVTSTYKEPFPGWIEGVRYIYIYNLILKLLYSIIRSTTKQPHSLGICQIFL